MAAAHARRQRIAYWQFDTSGVGNMTLINDTAERYPQTITFAYPKPGTTNSAVRAGVVAAAGGATTWLKTPGDPRNTYIASLDWMGPSAVVMQQLNRLQNENDYLLAISERPGTTPHIYQLIARYFITNLRTGGS